MQKNYTEPKPLPKLLGYCVRKVNNSNLRLKNINVALPTSFTPVSGRLWMLRAAATPYDLII
jgi:hypothetical protein